MNKYKTMIGIADEVHLEADLRNQSAYYFDIASELNKARNERETLHNQRKVKNAELDIAFRTEATVKLTESAISAKIAVHPEILAFDSAILQKEQEAGLLDAALKAMDHKRTALELLCKMQLAGILQAKAGIKP